jgi:hypothetical protein
MTHDELLDKVTNNSELEDCWMALQKVIILHGEVDGGCRVCRADYWAEDYPCKTIEVIQECFGVMQ